MSKLMASMMSEIDECLNDREFWWMVYIHVKAGRPRRNERIALTHYRVLILHDSAARSRKIDRYCKMCHWSRPFLYSMKLLEEAIHVGGDAVIECQPPCHSSPTSHKQNVFRATINDSLIGFTWLLGLLIIFRDTVFSYTVNKKSMYAL